MKPLPPPDSHHFQAAIGWLELGNHLEANEELEKITPALRAHPSVLEVRYEVYAKAVKWDVATEIARTLVQFRPEEPQYWLWQAYSARRMSGGGIAQAKEILDKAQVLFPKEVLIAYNLACYECQLGNLKEAWKWLEVAFDLGDAKKVKIIALDDRDLEPLWTGISEI